MAKFTLEFKKEVSEKYLEDELSLKSVARMYDISPCTVRKWAYAYREHGIGVLTGKKGRYSADFKLMVVKEVVDDCFSVRETAVKHGIPAFGTVCTWLEKYRKHGEDAFTRKNKKIIPVPDKSVTPVPPLPALIDVEREELEQLRVENAYLKKLKALVQQKTCSASEKVSIVNELRQEWPLSRLLIAAGLPRSTFYYHVKRLAAPDRYQSARALVLKIYHQHKGRYGYRRIRLACRNEGVLLNGKTVRKLMKELGISSLIRVKKYRSYKGEQGRICDNLLKRQFDAERPNEKWVTDVTEFKVNGKKLYLSPIMDLYNGEIIAYNLATRPLPSMVQTMLTDALKQLPKDEHPILHSDQGWQYQMSRWQRWLKDSGIVQSMSRRGNCLDNAVIESFFGTLKSECYYLNEYKSVEELKRDIISYIDYYNNLRIKEKLGGLSPIEYRLRQAA
ncbi:IS3 family transposase [Salmonella enterica]|nr:IS3 family transposase [Salmonella enterica]ECB2072215.1 IS3 family transposase [Salmonella enterica subsp. enterica serovar Benin]EEJ5472025.1 IS3 family transposase [Salmonella enterica subsp. diarizonae]EBE6988948.1 IS3 family transposase [Salmonella enterica]EBE7299508.1 IS3 family transposase [Salmonella enterica]